jgi:hypothetical protein
MKDRVYLVNHSPQDKPRIIEYITATWVSIQSGRLVFWKFTKDDGDIKIREFNILNDSVYFDDLSGRSE